MKKQCDLRSPSIFSYRQFLRVFQNDIKAGDFQDCPLLEADWR